MSQRTEREKGGDIASNISQRKVEEVRAQAKPTADVKISDKGFTGVARHHTLRWKKKKRLESIHSPSIEKCLLGARKKKPSADKKNALLIRGERKGIGVREGAKSSTAADVLLKVAKKLGNEKRARSAALGGRKGNASVVLETKKKDI